MTSAAVKTEKLVKVYSAGVKALDEIDLSIEEGEVFGLIGPNGAGKSTTIRILATLLKPTSGTVTIMGHDIEKEQMEVRKIISYLPEDAGAYENLTGREYLRFMLGFYDLNEEQTLTLGLQIADLKERIDSKVKEYSKGMKRRLLIARTLMIKPKIAILDEPTAGLDVMHGYYVRQEIKNAIKSGGMTSILSSHNLLEVEFLCDRVALINKGRILDSGTPQGLKEKYSAQNLEEVFFGAVKNG